jgi:hypothetical protein
MIGMQGPVEIDACTYEETYKGRFACPAAELPLDSFAKVAKFLGLFCIVAGLIMTFKGGKFINYVVAGVVGGFASLIFFYLAYTMFLNTNDAKEGVILGAIFASVAAGSLLSYMTYKFFKAMAVPIIAAAAGVIAALLLCKLAGVASTKG